MVGWSVLVTVLCVRVGVWLGVVGVGVGGPVVVVMDKGGNHGEWRVGVGSG